MCKLYLDTTVWQIAAGICTVIKSVCVMCLFLVGLWLALQLSQIGSSSSPVKAEHAHHVQDQCCSGVCVQAYKTSWQ